MIKTIFDITVDIDDEGFDITVRRPTKDEERTALQTFEKLKTIATNADKTAAEIKVLEDEYRVKQGVAEAATKNKETLWREALEVGKKIDALRETLQEADGLADALKTASEESAKKTFELTVSGGAKEKLKKSLAEKNISYFELIQEIRTIITEYEKKKLKSSAGSRAN